MPTIAQLVVWIIVGLVGGTLAGLATTFSTRGYGMGRNLGIGLIGAVIGGLLFRLLGLWPGLDQISISLRDVVSAFLGSLIVLGALWAWHRWGRGQVGTGFEGLARKPRRLKRRISGAMAGLVPAIHGCSLVTDVDPRDKPGDDVSIGGLRVRPGGAPPSPQFWNGIVLPGCLACSLV